MQKTEQELKEMTTRCQNAEISHTYMGHPGEEKTTESPENDELEACDDLEKTRKELSKWKRLWRPPQRRSCKRELAFFCS